MDGGETMPIVDLFAADWDHERSRPGFTSKSMDVGIRAGGELLGATLYECPPGNPVWPTTCITRTRRCCSLRRGRRRFGRPRVSARSGAERSSSSGAARRVRTRS
jgi:hypothetical protein